MADSSAPIFGNGMAKAVLRTLRGEEIQVVAKSEKVNLQSLTEARDKFVEAGTKAVAVETPKGSDRRHDIILVAIRLFSERGFRSTRLEDISEALGMTRPALYYYYKNKDELLVAVAEYAVQARGLHGFSDPVAADADPAMEIAARVEDRVNHLLTTDLPLYRMLLQERHELPKAATDILTEDQVSEVRSLANLLKLGITAGTFADFNPTMMASTIMALIAGTARWFDPKRSKAEEAARLISYIAAHGILTETPARSDLPVSGKTRPTRRRPARKAIRGG